MRERERVCVQIKVNHFSTNGCMGNHLWTFYKLGFSRSSKPSLLSQLITYLPFEKTCTTLRSKMVFKHMFVCLVCVVLLCLVFMEETSDCGGGHGCFYSKAAASLKTENRKLLAGLKEKKEAVKGGQQVSATSTRNGRSFVGWELRKVPSGPDPLHHNGGSPKKPRTP